MQNLLYFEFGFVFDADFVDAIALMCSMCKSDEKVDKYIAEKNFALSADQIDKNDFNMLCLQPAIRRRDIVRQQCSNIEAEKSFSKPMPDYRVVGL